MLSFNELIMALGLGALVLGIGYIVFMIAESDYWVRREKRKIDKWTRELLEKDKEKKK